MLVVPDRRIRDRTVPLTELAERDIRDFRPVAMCGVEIEALVQIDLHPQPRLVDIEEVTEPGREEPDHVRVAVRERHRTIGLRTLAGIQRNSGGEERLLAQRLEADAAFGVELLDLSELGDALWMWTAVGAVPALGWGEGDVADPEGDGGLADAESGGNVSEREVLRTEHARLLLLLDLAAIAHALSIANVRSIGQKPRAGRRMG